MTMLQCYVSSPNIMILEIDLPMILETDLSDHHIDNISVCFVSSVEAVVFSWHGTYAQVLHCANFVVQRRPLLQFPLQQKFL
jgi:hypothetical protein